MCLLAFLPPPPPFPASCGLVKRGAANRKRKEECEAFFCHLFLAALALCGGWELFLDCKALDGEMGGNYCVNAVKKLKMSQKIKTRVQKNPHDIECILWR